MQNIEKSLRKIYIPDLGKVFVQVDQSGAEALIVAYLSRPAAYRTLFEQNIKPHVYVAMRLFSHIWHKKMLEHRMLTADTPFDIDSVIATPIPELKKIPYWKALDSCIKDSDNWSLSERYYYLAKQTCHCVDSKTEVLTPNGWVFVKDYVTGPIAVVDSDRNIFFEEPKTWNKSEYSGTMYHFKGEETDQFVTDNHTIVYNTNGIDRELPANVVAKYNRVNIPTSGHYVGGKVNLPDWQVKLLVAIQADACWYAKTSVRFRFVKERKMQRLESILNEAGIKFEKRLTDVTEYYVHDLGDTLKHFGLVKRWGSWLLNLSKNNLELLIDELKHWDGTFEESYLHKREAYFSKYHQNATWIKTICHLVGKQGTVLCSNGMYAVGINNRKKSIANRIKAYKYTTMVYCPTVSTGRFLIRRRDKISVTGNSSNYGITPPTFRMNVLEKSGGKIVISKDDAEHFICTYQSLFTEIFEWHDVVRKQVEETGFLYNLHGEPYTIIKYDIPESKWKEFYAWIPQSTVGEITNIAFVQHQQYIEACNNYRRNATQLHARVAQALDIFGAGAYNADQLANTHDSYMCQVDEDQMERCAKVMSFFINQSFVSPVDGTPFSMRSEAQAGYNWSPAKETNPNGLKEVRV